MIDKCAPMDLVDRMSHVAASASERFVPRPVQRVVDRTLVDMACVNARGVASVARSLQVDVPAVDAWRRLGVPTEMRGRLTAVAMRPSLPARPAFAFRRAA